MHARIEAVSCWQYPSGMGVGMGAGMGIGLGGGGLGTATAQAELDVAATDMLKQALNAAFPDNPPPDTSSAVVQGHPAHVLLTMSAEPDVDLLVVGSRGHGGFVGLLIGSTSAYCAEHAACPVMVVHDHDHADRTNPHD